jgi:hypothetical protein
MPQFETLSRTSSRRICIVGTLLFLLYAGMLSWKSIAGFPTAIATHQHWPWLGNKPFGEDGFYLLTVSNTLATTHHLAYNYGRTATGIQPLITFVFAGVAWIVHSFHGDRWMLVRVLIFFNTSLFMLFAWQMAWIAERFAPAERRNLVFVFAFYLVIGDFALFRLFNYGLETGIYLLLISCAYRLTLRMTRSGAATWQEAIGLGVVSGFAGLARIDFGVILAVVFCFLLARRLMTFLQVLVCGFTALIIISPWFLFIHSTIGSWMPSSGQMESGKISLGQLDRIGAMAASLLPNIAPWVFRFTSPYSLATWFGCASVGFLLVLLYRSPETRAWLRARGGYLYQAAPWITAFVILTLVYTLGFRVTGFYTRYTAPLLIITVPLIAMIFSGRTAFIHRPGLVIGPLLLVFSIYDVASLHGGNVGSNWIITAGYVQQYYPDAHVAAFQSGTIGFFDSNVDNLDGKLNYDALRATNENRMPEYIDQQGYSVLVDWTSYFEGLPADYLQREWIACPHPMYAPDSTCLVRKAVQ